MSKKKRYEYHANAEFSKEELKDRRAKKRAMRDTHKDNWKFNLREYDANYDNEEWEDDR